MTDEHAQPQAGPEALMAEAGARLVAAVRTLGADWVVTVVTTRIDQWGALDPAERAAARAAAEAAGARAAARVADALEVLLARPAGEQPSTPLEVMRSLRSEATEVLADAGVPPVVRDDFEARAFPDDVYGIVLRSPVELGDDDLGGVLLAWGLAKTRVLRGPTALD
ncbi:MAG: hypothetical protein ACKOOG_15810 [Actinomycetota bacterium]